MTDWYKAYLQSRHWKALRGRLQAKRGRKCEDCGNPYEVIHHRTYTNLGIENFEDLSMMCRICHLKLHTRMKKDNVILEGIDIIRELEPPKLIIPLLPKHYLNKVLKARRWQISGMKT